MTSSFNSRSYNIRGVLGRASFAEYATRCVKVPAFQRPFSWGKGHISTFWDDILTFRQDSNPGDQYFLGPLVIIPYTDYIGLLDGQQRLAAITILLSSIRDALRSIGGTEGANKARDIQRDFLFADDDDSEYALSLSKIDSEFFGSIVQKDPPENAIKPKIRSHRLLQEAKRFFDAELKTLVDGNSADDAVAELVSVKNTIVNDLKVVAIEVASEDEAYVIFESLNDRGLRLQVPDLLLNFLMLSAKSEGDRKIVRDKWDKIAELLGTHKVSDFVRSMWVSKFGDVKSQGLYRTIKSHIKSKKISSKAFVSLCLDECENFVAIVDFTESKLGKAHDSTRALLHSIGATKSIPLLLSAMRHLEQNNFEVVARLTLAFIVRHDVLANLNRPISEELLFEAARVLDTHCQKNKTKAGQNAAVREVRKMLVSKDPDKSTLVEASRSIHLRQREAAYVLAQIALHMEKKGKVFDIGKVTLEHIFPQNATKSEWPNIDKLAGLEWHMGNLSLLEKSLNEDAGNLHISKKNKFYGSSELVMSKSLASKNSWEEDDIMTRAKKLATLADAVWRIA